ncbi:hypothetical protein NHJ13734_009218 [Beauveria thailandica]
MDLTDVDIYPLYDFDRRPDVEALHMSWLFHVNARLDPQMLRSSLSELLQMGDWRKFAGRFRRNRDGLLELHTPHSFPEDYEIVGYSHRDLSDTEAIKFKDFTQASANGRPLSLRTPPICPELLCHNKAMANGTMETWIQNCLPPLALHITTSKKSTVISLLWRHTIADGGGMADLVRSWSLVLGDKRDDVPALLGAKENNLWQIGEKARRKSDEEWCLKGKSLRPWAMCKMFVQLMWRRLTVPRYEERTFLLPGSFVEGLKGRCARELEACQLQNLPTFGDGLIMRSWFLEKIVEAEPTASNLLLTMPVNPRPRLLQFRQSNGVYVQNMLSWVFASLSRSIFHGSLATIAAEVRQRTLEQVTPAQIAAYYSFKHAQAENRIPTEKMFYFTENPGNDFPVFYNDLGSLELREKIDFGPAILSQGLAGAIREISPGKSTFFKQLILGDPIFNGDLRLPFIMCNGKDTSGNYHFYAILSRITWDLLEQDYNQAY